MARCSTLPLQHSHVHYMYTEHLDRRATVHNYFVRSLLKARRKVVQTAKTPPQEAVVEHTSMQVTLLRTDDPRR